MYRQAVVSNTFYPSEVKKLESFIKQYAGKAEYSARAVICPHAGYIYSGKTAVKTLSSIKIPDNIIILGPNHTGLGDSVALYPQGEWETPLGNIKINKEIYNYLNKYSFIQEDYLAHLKEHSIEVILPILKYFNENISISPICLQFLDLNYCEKVADAIYSIMKEDKNILLVVSSDMNHFEPADISKIKDNMAIEKALSMNAAGLYETVIKNKISMCGVIPATIAIMVMNKLGIENSKLIHYSHSGMVNGDESSVVGYAGIIFY
jgi:AmmeMemoRadiSam system protein B